jgi:hypothetical protein
MLETKVGSSFTLKQLAEFAEGHMKRVNYLTAALKGDTSNLREVMLEGQSVTEGPKRGISKTLTEISRNTRELRKALQGWKDCVKAMERRPV